MEIKIYRIVNKDSEGYREFSDNIYLPDGVEILQFP